MGEWHKQKKTKKKKKNSSNRLDHDSLLLEKSLQIFKTMAVDQHRLGTKSAGKKSVAPLTATSRLRNDYMRLKKDPVPYIVAEPNPSNILEWHYVVSGPPDTPY